MNNPDNAPRQDPTAQRDQYQPSEPDLDEDLILDRTRSQEVNVAESVAVQELPPDGAKHPPDDDDQDEPAPVTWPSSVKYLVMLCAFLTSLSFGVTQVPLLYVFRLMTCDAYYEEHTPGVVDSSFWLIKTRPSILSYALAPIAAPLMSEAQGDHDRCSLHEIESSTALSVSLLGASTMVFGLLNLFLTGSLIKRIGVKPTLVIQVFFPALRLLIQNVGVEVWGNTGIVIVQLSQILTIIGGPSGYVLALNNFITEVVEYEARTAALGRLAGSMMSGAAFGFLLGGVVAESFNIKAPFRLTLVLFLISSLYVLIFLPHIPPPNAKVNDQNSLGEKKKRALSDLIGPLATFTPRKYVVKDGIVRTEFGAFLLAWGVFLGILATGYLPTMLQLYSTDVFGFGTKDNGWLIFMYSMLRGIFLTFAFPKLIALGRKFTIKKEEEARSAKITDESDSSERQPLLAPPANQVEDDINKSKKEKKEQTFTFDLTYTRFSLITDGLLTLLCSFVRQGWQMYLVAAVLPFAAGTGSAAKGTILQMVGGSASSAQRTDALAGVSLVENMARLSTTFVFGVVFAGFAKVGRTELVFTCNAAVALIAFGVLLLARFPLEGSRPLEKEESSTEGS